MPQCAGGPKSAEVPRLFSHRGARLLTELYRVQCRGLAPEGLEHEDGDLVSDVTADEIVRRKSSLSHVAWGTQTPRLPRVCGISAQIDGRTPCRSLTWLAIASTRVSGTGYSAITASLTPRRCFNGVGCGTRGRRRGRGWLVELLSGSSRNVGGSTVDWDSAKETTCTCAKQRFSESL